MGRYPKNRKGYVYGRRHKLPAPSARRNVLLARVNKIAKMVRAAKPELKYAWNYASTAITNDPTAGIFPHRSITQGLTDVGSRVGDDIKSKRFTCTGALQLPALSNGQVFRAIAFIYKKNPDAITTSFATIINLYLESTTMNTSYAPYAFMDWDNHGDFATLYDRTVVINPSDSAYTTLKKFNFSFNIPKKYENCVYANGGTYPSENELVIAFVSSGDSVVTYNYTWRLSYTDP